MEMMEAVLGVMSLQSFWTMQSLVVTVVATHQFKVAIASSQISMK